MAEYTYIKRHALSTRLWHWTLVICCFLLILSGLVIFIPALAAALPHGVVKGIQMTHRIFGVVFALATVLYVVITPKQIIHSMKNIFAKWDADDKKFMKYFLPYLFNPAKYHMPKQQFVKSGQRLSDFFMYILIFFISITGIILLAGDFTPINATLLAWSRFGHDLCFFGMCVLLVVHIYLGAGIFQPYRRSIFLMFGDGTVGESDALYHWGHWAENELKAGKNLVEKPE